MKTTVFITPRVKPLDRRTLLRGAANVSIGLPFLDIMRPRHARAAGPAKKCLIVFMTGNGISPENWWPKSGGDSLNLAGTSLQVLADQGLQNDVVMVSGVSNKIYPGGGRPHPKATAQALTATPLVSSNYPTGISIDQVISNKISPDRRSIELGVGVIRNDAGSTCSYTGMGTPLPREGDPARVVARLFSNPAPSNPEELMRLKASRKSVLDFAKGDCDRVRALLGTEDRVKFEKYCDEIANMTKAVDRLEASNCSAPNLGTVPAFKTLTNVPALMKIQTDLMMKALSCEATRVASIQVGNGGDPGLSYPWIGIGAHHSLSHSNNSADMAKVDRWAAEQFAYMVKRAKETPGPDGTPLIDSSLLMWVNEMSLGRAHSTERLPYVLAGRLGGKLRTGRYVEAAGGPSSGRLFVSVANAFDVPITSFGSAAAGTGPVSGIFT